MNDFMEPWEAKRNQPRCARNLKREIAGYLRGVRRPKPRRNRNNQPANPGKAFKVFAFLAVVAIILTVIGCENQENQKRGLVSGLILDNLGNRLQGAQITSHRSLFKAESGKDGRYSFTSLDAGTHRLTVERFGYKSASRTVIIESAEEHEAIDFTLEPVAVPITWSLFSRASDTITLDAATAETMKCQVVYQGEHQPQMRTPFTVPGTDHRFVITPLLPATYRFFVVGITPDGRQFESASGTFLPTPAGDIPGAPPVPVEVRVQQTPSGVKLSWNYTGEDPLKGFRLYRSEKDKSLVLWRDENDIFANLRSVVDEDAKPGVYTQYAMEAVDLDGAVSSRTEAIPFMPAGRLTEDVTWKKSYGIINLFGDIRVPKDREMIVESGVIVRVNASDSSESGVEPTKCEIFSEGVLRISGAKEDPVRFISSSALPNRKDWAGLRLTTASGKTGSKVSYVEVFNAQSGLLITDSSVEIGDFSARYCENGILFQNASAAVAINIACIDCARGLSAVETWNCRVQGLTVQGGDYGAWLQGNRSFSLNSGDIRDCLEAGLRLSDTASLTVRNMIVDSAKLGVWVNGGVATLTYLTIDAPSGILVDQPDTPIIRNCIIVNRRRPNTGNGLEDLTIGRSYPYDNIFGFLNPVAGCNQNGGPVLNVDPLFVGITAGKYDYHLQETSLLITASENGAEMGAFGTSE